IVPQGPQPGGARDLEELATGGQTSPTTTPVGEPEQSLFGLSSPTQAAATGGLTVVVVAIVLAVYVAIVLSVGSSLRRRRRERARDASAAVLVSWQEL